MELKDKKVIVLGGSSGIGLAVAQGAAAAGAEVLIASSNAARIDQALTTLPAGSEGRVLDLHDGGAIERLFETAGAFDHLVNTAGDTLRLATLDQLGVDQARRFFDLRFWGAYAAVRAAHRHIRPGGSIVLTSGVAGARPGAGWSIPAAICAAMEGLTRALAVELAPLRINAVVPGVVRSPLWRDMSEEARASLYAGEAARLPVGHVAELDEVARAYLYLMGQTSATGQALAVDGGGLLV